MVIVIINWRILPTKVDDFLGKWKTGLRLNNAPGLIGEFLSKVENISFAESVTWEFEPDEKDDKSAWKATSYVSYVNVGLWETYLDFDNAVGKYMAKGRIVKEEFEAAPRRRAIVSPEFWRRGSNDLPSSTSKGVSP